MPSAVLVFGYTVAMAWAVPVLLGRLTRHGISARLGLCAWLTAMASVLASAAAAVALLAGAAVAGWPRLARAVCQSVAGRACTPVIYRSAAFEVPLGAAAIAATVAAAVLAWRYGRSVVRARQHTRAHAEAARITGRLLVTGHGAAGTVTGERGRATVVLDAARPAAYCVPGRPGAIVLTSGALAVLGPEQLGAVLAHERAHLAGRHHLLIVLTRALAASFPGVPVFTQGAAEVARLAELCADDAAARRTSRPALVAALLAMGTGMPVPTTALAATTGPVTARVGRLLAPPRRGRQAGYGLALSAATLLLAGLPVLVIAVAGHLFPPG